MFASIYPPIHRNYSVFIRTGEAPDEQCSGGLAREPESSSSQKSRFSNSEIPVTDSEHFRRNLSDPCRRVPTRFGCRYLFPPGNSPNELMKPRYRAAQWRALESTEWRAHSGEKLRWLLRGEARGERQGTQFRCQNRCTTVESVLDVKFRVFSTFPLFRHNGERWLATERVSERAPERRVSRLPSERV